MADEKANDEFEFSMLPGSRDGDDQGTEENDTQPEEKVKGNEVPATFSVNGTDYTEAEIDAGMMRHADYTRKMQELSQRRNAPEAKEKPKESFSEIEILRQEIYNQNLSNEIRRLRTDDETFSANEDAIMQYAVDNQLGDIHVATAAFKGANPGKIVNSIKSKAESQSRSANASSEGKTGRAAAGRQSFKIIDGEAPGAGFTRWQNMR